MHPANSKWKSAGTIDAAVDIGHVHLKVSELERALDFYCGVLGFELMTYYGDSAAFGDEQGFAIMAAVIFLAFLLVGLCALIGERLRA